MAVAAFQQNELQTTIEGVNGFRAAGVHCGLRTRGALDLALVAADQDCNAAGIFTTNQVKSAHVRYDMARLLEDPTRIRGVVVNSKIANVSTGRQGEANTARMATLTAEKLGCQPEQILVMSTGIIGAQLPMHKVERGIEAAAGSLAKDARGWHTSAIAIMTTDTRPKMASISTAGYTLAGMAKGSGMVAPNMATMLSLLVTDAAIPAELLRELLKDAADESYNRITVDGDTSTSDTVLLLANGSSGVNITEGDALEEFAAQLKRLTRYLAKEVVRDGEGATKFIAIEVVGTADDHAAWVIANSIANSPLVKTAFAGGDANWGRIMMAAGKCGIPFDQDTTSLWFDYGGEGIGENGLLVLQEGTPTNYTETDAADIFAAREISLRLSVGTGPGSSIVWTCDMGHDYVSINADYRT